MKKYIFVEILCIILTLVFVINSITPEKATHKTAKEITDEIAASAYDSTLKERDGLFIKEAFGFDLTEFLSYSYYSSDDIMNVTEVFVGIVNGSFDEKIKAAFEKYQSEKYNLFNGYAPEQAALLDSFIYDEVSGAVVFIVAENAEDIYSAISEALD